MSLQVISGHLGWVRCIAVEPGNEWFVTGAGDRVIKVCMNPSLLISFELLSFQTKHLEQKLWKLKTVLSFGGLVGGWVGGWGWYNSIYTWRKGLRSTSKWSVFFLKSHLFFSFFSARYNGLTECIYKERNVFFTSVVILIVTFFMLFSWWRKVAS